MGNPTFPEDPGQTCVVDSYPLVISLFFSFFFVIMRSLFLSTKSLMQRLLWREQNL